MFWHIYVVCFQPDLPWSIDHFPSRCHQVLTLTFGMMFFGICLGLLTVGSSQVQTQNWKQLQLATNHETNHVWNRMLVFLFVARCWERVQFFLTGLCSFFWWGWRRRWGLGLLRSKLKNGNSCSWQQIMKQIMFGTKCWYFFCGKMLGKSPFFFDWAMFFLWAWRWRWGLGLLTVGSSQVQTPNWKESVQAGNKSRLEQNARFFFVARGWERVQSFDWAMHFFLVRLTVWPYR